MKRILGYLGLLMVLLCSPAWAISYYIAVGSNHGVLRSTDGLTWTQAYRDTNHPVPFYNITPNADDSIILVTGQGDNLYPTFPDYYLRSTDQGVTWIKSLTAPHNIDSGFDMGSQMSNLNTADFVGKNGEGAIWNGSKFDLAFTGFTPVEVSSPDALAANWTIVGYASMLTTGTNPSGVWNATAGKYFVWIRQNSVVDLCSSPDLINFTIIQEFDFNSAPYIVQRGSTIVAFGGSLGGVTRTSVSTNNGSTWTHYSTTLSLNDSHGSDCVFFDTVTNLAIILANNCDTTCDQQGIYTSPDWITWTARKVGSSAPFLQGITRTAAGAGHLAVTGDSGAFFTSTDALTWTEVGTQFESPDFAITNEWLFHTGSVYLTYQHIVASNKNVMATSCTGAPNSWTPTFTLANSGGDTVEQFNGFSTDNGAPCGGLVMGELIMP